MKVFDSTGTPKVTSVAAGKDLDFFRQAGTNPLEDWYGLGMAGSSQALTTGAPAIDVLWAIPFISRRGGTMDQIAVNVTTLAAGGLAKLAIYNNTSDTVMYPGTLLVATAEFVTSTTGVKATTINQALTSNTIYWAVYWTGILAATIRAPGVVNMGFGPLGFTNALGTAPSWGVQPALTYTTSFPNTFTAGGAIVSAAPIPAIFGRFSA